MNKTLFRSRTDRMIGGVLGGFAKYFKLDSTWMRVIFAVLFVFSLSSLGLLYLILWMVIPLEPVETTFREEGESKK